MEERVRRIYGHLKLLRDTERETPGFLNKDIEDGVNALLLELDLGRSPSLYQVALLCESIRAYEKRHPFLDFVVLMLQIYRDRIADLSSIPPTSNQKPAQGMEK